MQKFNLSIIIPTYNRQKFALYSVKQIINTTSEKVQVVIQDNSDDSSLLNELQTISGFETRIKYAHTNEILSFVDNFSKGVEMADGKYICMIGDDDAINSEVENVIEWAIDKNIKAINPKVRVNYFWPNTKVSAFKSDNGNFLIYPFTGKVEYFKTEPELKKLLASGGQNYLDYNLVKVYHGIVLKSEFDKIKEKTGRYFGGLSPDIHSAVSLSLIIEEVVVIDYPLTIPGVCSESGSGHSATGRHHGKLEDAPQLKGHSNYAWTDLIPKFYSVETLWADSAIAAFVDMKRQDMLKEFNHSALSALTLYKYKNFRNMILKYYFKNPNAKNQVQDLLSLVQSTIKFPITNLFRRVLNKLTTKDQPLIIENVRTIIDAELLLRKTLKKENKRIKNLLQ